MSNKTIISIDLEFNKLYRPLSLGYECSNGISNELYFKNETDFSSYKIHGIPNYFLNKYGKDFRREKEQIVSYLKMHDYILGFNISNDFKALRMNDYYLLYQDNKVIDIEIIINLFNINLSLFNLFKVFNINIRADGLTTHSALFDSMATMSILNKMIMIAQSKNINREELISDFSKITSSVYLRGLGDIECGLFVSKYKLLFIDMKLENINSNPMDEEIFFSCKYKNFSLFLNKEKEIVYKIPNIFINENFLNYREYRIKIKENLFTGYRFPIGEQINNILIKSNLKKWSFF